jgi:hypothetical protein
VDSASGLKGSDSFVKMRSAHCKSSYCTSELSPVSSSSCRHDTHTECICDANASALMQKNQRVVLGRYPASEISRSVKLLFDATLTLVVVRVAGLRGWQTCCRLGSRQFGLALRQRSGCRWCQNLRPHVGSTLSSSVKRRSTSRHGETMMSGKSREMRKTRKGAHT